MQDLWVMRYEARKSGSMIADSVCLIDKLVRDSGVLHSDVPLHELWPGPGVERFFHKMCKDS